MRPKPGSAGSKERSDAMSDAISDELARALVSLDRDTAWALVQRRAEAGDDPIEIVEACRQGMTIVGDRFQTGEYFLAELLLSAEIFKKAMTILDPFLSKAPTVEPRGKVVLATLKGDIHDLGKDIFGTLLKAQGFEIHDLGVDVPAAVVIDKVKSVEPDFVGFSALITTAFRAMEETVTTLTEAGLRDRLKLMIGGGIATPMLRDHLSADFQTIDAMEGVDYCMRTAKGG